LYRVSLADRLSGWVIKAAGRGYADKIEILIGLNPDAKTISGIFILEQKETPGLGNKISLSQWRNQFIQKSTALPLTVVKGKSATSNSIDAVTGATISSRSVTGIVNRTIEDIKGRLNPANIR
jgi:electron transport complex protein RnfG